MPRVITTAALLAVTAAALAACGDAPTAPRSDDGRRPTGAKKTVYAALSYTDLGWLNGGTSAEAFAVNGPGQVVGYAGDPDGHSHAFVWQSGGMREITPPSWETWTFSTATAINARGQAAVTARDASGALHGYLWENGGLTDLGSLGGGTDAEDVNALGAVVGGSFTAAGPEHAFLWSAGVMQDIGGTAGADNSARAINDLGQVVGEIDVPGTSYEHAFLWQNGVMQDLGTFGGSSSTPADINNVGQIVGEYLPSGVGLLNTHAFLWENGVARDLGTFGGVRSSARAVNDLGQVVGSATRLGSSPVAVIWEDGEARELGVPTGGTAAGARGINDLGQVVGAVDEPDGRHAILWTVAIRAPIDVVPGDATNTIKLASKGNVTVDVFGGKYFDATRIDPATVTLGNEDGNDTAVIRRKDGSLAAVFKDLNKDGFPDLELLFDSGEMRLRGDLTATTTRLVLTGARTDARQIRGVNAVHVM